MKMDNDNNNKKRGSTVRTIFAPFTVYIPMTRVDTSRAVIFEASL